MFSTFRAAFGLLRRRRRWMFAVVIVIALVVSLLEAGSAVLILALLQLTVASQKTITLPVIGRLDRLVPAASTNDMVAGLGVVFVGFFLLRAAVFLVQQYVQARVTEGAGVELSHSLLRGYLAAPYRFHLRRNSAESVRNVWDNVQQLLQMVLVPATNLVAESMLIVLMLVVLLLSDPISTALAIVVLGSAVAVTMAVVQPRLKRLGRQRQRAVSESLRHVQQGLQGVRDIKVSSSEDAFAAAYRRARYRVGRAAYRKAALAYLPRVTLETAFLLLVIVLVVASRFVSSLGGLAPVLGLFAYAGMRLQPSLQKVAQAMNSVKYGEPVVEELCRDIAELDIRVEPAPATATSSTGSTSPLQFDELVVDHVTFAYDDAGAPVLQDVVVSIRPGKSVAIAGPTGCGKSTLLDLISGLLEPIGGHVLVDGSDIRARLDRWHRSIGVVHQHSFLTDDTVRRNIAFGLPDDQIDDALLRRVIVAAELDGVVDALQIGVDTSLGERGVRLSGGQRQRIAIARALYRQPRLLLLDEATSALDNATEARVVRNIRAFGDNLAIVAVAHRMRTIEHCDTVVFLDGGRMVASGTFDEVRSSTPAFAEMSA